MRVPSIRPILDVWWIQWILGLGVVGLALLPWLLGENRIQLNAAGQTASEPSLLPHSTLQAYLLWIALGFCALAAGFFVRAVARGGRQFFLVLGLGLLFGWIGAGYQSWTVLTQHSASSASIQSHLIGLLSGLLLMFLSYWVIARLDLRWVTVGVALLSFSPGAWLAHGGNETGWGLPSEFLGPILVGLVLGAVGFSRVSALLLWVMTLLLQWITPGILVTIQQSLNSPGEILSSAQLWELFVSETLHSRWVMLSVVTLATAMVLSVLLLVIGRVRNRR